MSNPILNARRFASAAARSGDDPNAAGWASPRSSGNSGFPPPGVFDPSESFERRSDVARTTRSSDDAMTVSGAMSAASLLGVLLVAAAVFGWTQVDTSRGMGVVFGGALVGLIMVIASTFRPRWARVLAPVYALAQGTVVGAVSKVFDASYPGIVVQAVGVTMGVFLTMLLLYRSGVIRVTARFRSVVFGATLGVLAFYVTAFVASLLGWSMLADLLASNGVVGIGLSVLVAGIAAVNLAVDFDFIERAADQRLPKHMEWLAALGLVVTVVWLYLEILRLLAKLRSR